jgi:hypothetical protein
MTDLLSDPFRPSYGMSAAVASSGYTPLGFKNAVSQLKIFQPDAREGRYGRWSQASLFTMRYARVCGGMIRKPVSSFVPFGQHAFQHMYDNELLDNDDRRVVQAIVFEATGRSIIGYINADGMDPGGSLRLLSDPCFLVPITEMWRVVKRELRDFGEDQ